MIAALKKEPRISKIPSPSVAVEKLPPNIFKKLLRSIPINLQFKKELKPPFPT